MFGKGLFIRNDEDGNPCKVGDRVKIITEGFWEERLDIDPYSSDGTFDCVDNGEEHPETTHIGKLYLSKTKGIYLIIEQQFNKYEGKEKKEIEFTKGQNRQFTNLKMTKNTRLKQDWFLLNNIIELGKI